MNKVNVKDLSPEELKEFVIKLGEKPYRAHQIGKWVYKKGVSSFNEMTDLSKDFRRLLNESAMISNINLVQEQISSDGTKKYLFELQDGNRIESVLIPDDHRFTLCI